MVRGAEQKKNDQLSESQEVEEEEDQTFKKKKHIWSLFCYIDQPNQNLFSTWFFIK